MLDDFAIPECDLSEFETMAEDGAFPMLKTKDFSGLSAENMLEIMSGKKATVKKRIPDFFYRLK